MVALAVIKDELNVNLGLVHAEANQFVRANTEPFDFIILNELLDDMPCRAFFADAEGGATRPSRSPAATTSTGRCGSRRATPEAPRSTGSPPARSPRTRPTGSSSSRGSPARCGPGGMLLVHDYGFAEPFTALDKYASPQAMLAVLRRRQLRRPGGRRLPAQLLPRLRERGQARAPGHERRELRRARRGARGHRHRVLGPARKRQGEQRHARREGRGLFLSEFGLLEPDDDLPMLLARLQHDQACIRDDYAREYTGGRGNVFLDLVYVRA